jgi:hypothetical protein
MRTLGGLLVALIVVGIIADYLGLFDFLAFWQHAMVKVAAIIPSLFNLGFVLLGLAILSFCITRLFRGGK